VGDYLDRLRAFPRAAWLYLLSAALVTGSLAISSLLWNLVVLALGFPRSFLGTLGVVGVASAALLSLPLWWLVSRIGLRTALLSSALLQAAGAFLVAAWPAEATLLLAAGVTGAAAVLFQVSAAPYMMRHSDAATRDHLFSTNAAVNVGVAGLGSLLAGQLPTWFATLLSVAPESSTAYRASFAIAGAGLLLALVPLLLSNAEATTLNAEPKAEATTLNAEPKAEATTLNAEQAAAETSPSGLNGTGIPEQTFSVQRSAFSVPDRLQRSAFSVPDRLQRSAFSVPTAFSLPVTLLIPPTLISLGAALLVPYLNLFFKERFALPDQVLGALFAALGVATGLSSLAAPLVSARLGKPAAIVLTQALSIPFLLAIGFVTAPEIAALAAIARGVLFNMSAPLYDALAMERSTPAARPAVIGMINAAYASGYLVAPPVSVTVQERWGFTPLFVATAACYALAVLAVFWFFARNAATPNNGSPRRPEPAS
jgi:MFS family permease